MTFHGICAVSSDFKTQISGSPTVRSHPLVPILCAFGFGIAIDRNLSRLHDERAEVALFSIAIAGWVTWWLLLHRSKRVRLAAFMLLLTIATTMGLKHHVSWRLLPTDHILFGTLATKLCEPVATHPVVVECQVLTCPESTPLPEAQPLATVPQGISTRFRVRVQRVRDGLQWRTASGDVQVRLNGQLLGVNIGDQVRILGHLSLAPPPLNPGEDDIGMSERSDGIWARLNVAFPDCVLLIQASQRKDFPFSTLGRIRTNGLRLLDQHVKSPQAVLAGALLLGARDRLEPGRTEAFFHTGTVHLLAISGLHVGILAWVFLVAARSCSAKRRLRVLQILMLLTIMYCYLTGLRAPVLRASILVLVVCAALIYRRKVLAYNALATAAIGVLLWRPGDLFRPGAQLSFLAVAALIWLGGQLNDEQLSPLDRLIERSRPWYQKLLKELCLRAGQLAKAGFVVWLVALPLVMLRFHLVSPIALALNVVLAVPIAIGLLSGFGVLVTGAISPSIAALCGRACYLCLAFVEWAVHAAHEIPGAYGWFAGPHPAWCAVYYAALTIFVLRPQLRPTGRWPLVLFLFWLAAPVAVSWIQDVRRSERPLRCTFLSVGHGTSVVIEMPDGRVVLYDSGRMGLPQPGERIVSSYLWHRQINHIDAIIVSHADADHYNIIPELLNRFSVGQVFVSHVMFNRQSTGTSILRQSITDANVPMHHLMADDELMLGRVRVCVLHPLAEGVNGNDNSNSIVLAIEHGGQSILLPGDLEARGLDQVMAEMPRDTTVLMAPHHGSSRSKPVEFSQWCQPEFVVISGGFQPDRNRQQRRLYNTPGRQVFHTSEDGAITVEVWLDRIEVTPWITSQE